MAEVVIVGAMLVAVLGSIAVSLYGCRTATCDVHRRYHKDKILRTGIRYKQPCTVSDETYARWNDAPVSFKARCRRKLSSFAAKKDVRIFADGHVEACGLTSYPTTECAICLEQCKVSNLVHHAPT
jgi:hypothetical protein